MTKQKILMVTTNHLDYDTRILNEADTLSKEYDLLIITTGFNRPDIKKKLPYHVKSVRTFLFRPQLLSRVLDLWPIIVGVWREKADIYHAHDLPGLFCVWPTVVIRRKFLVYDSHELWSDVALFGIWQIFRLPFRLFEKILVYKVNAIITVNKSLANVLKLRYRKPTLALYNYSVIAIKNKRQKLPDFKNKKIILYIGIFRQGRGLKQIVRAARYLDNSFQILFIGYGVYKEALKREITRNNLAKRCSVMNALPPDKLIGTIKKARLGCCLIENTCLSYYLSSPNKLFQYIAAEVPILASNFPEYRNIVLKEGIGELVDVNNPDEIAQKLKLMVQDKSQLQYRQNLKNLAFKKYSWKRESGKLLYFYKKYYKKSNSHYLAKN